MSDLCITNLRLTNSQVNLHITNGKKYIFIVNADKKLEQREVKLGLRNDSDVEIVGGLNDGEMIAVDNLSRLRHGLEVNIENEKGGSI